MTYTEIKQRLELIRANAKDGERAHILEDQLAWDFIAYVATVRNPSLRRKAKAVLQSKQMKFARWAG